MSDEEVRTITCSFANEGTLYMAYMPFLHGGGLFIRTNHSFNLGEKVSLVINLMDEPESYKIDGQVAWITPKGAQGSKPAGIGVQFIGEQCRHFCNKIETYLAGMLKSSQMTDTM
ncbi:PilZ domain-containing protein [Legionella spiritensis]|uniref:Type 4 fimbrial biogenesis protein PilZ n=1 Tax=Legionella spiritensis TaxID=452 RepID=A0A0W0Z4J7_LEGSP|nr:PilZ domain-containing protein [Legionella spiritensis]KTD64029.1 type 4 fimbrial biogenesis protein PilZ [Legionella spiritensis]SNV37289.1 type 4 fimbrial biogenesis protein PilZ [Legionella spiritensis]VEG90063.1 type 4 fimbrial biogenesis protein PilZ [Legionella spiritensis]